MSRQKQRNHSFRNNYQAAPIQLEEAKPEEFIKPVEVEHTPLHVEQELIVPEVIEESVLTQEAVDLEQEKIDRIHKNTAGVLKLEEVTEKVKLTAKMSILGIVQYINTMKETEGLAHYLMSDAGYVTNTGPAIQVKLYRDIMDIITKTDDADFEIAMDFVMHLFMVESKYLSFENLMRFQENIRLTPIELKCYPNLMVMLTTLCDPLTRTSKARKQIDLTKALEYGFSEAAKVRLLDYFNN